MIVERLHIPDQTIHDQRRAADPRASAWVSANAGAGKTKVLTDRVVRLLLTGAPPGRILCLTFTKAAAANMAIRVFDVLGRWVTLDDEALSAELVKLEGERPDAERLRMARTLFARAVETPGGLKIDTIHAFCERLLHLVPFEANVPARFTVLDEGQSAEMVEQALANVMGDAATGDHPDLADALHAVSIDASGEGLASAIKAAVRCREVLHHPGGVAAAIRRLRATLGLEADETVDGVERAMIEEGLPPADWPALIEALQGGKPTDQKRGAALLAAAEAPTHEERLGHYLSVFLTEELKPRAESTLVTKSVDATIKERLLAEQARLVALDDRRRAIRAVERTGALFTLAREINRRIEIHKARNGALEFDDLIAKTLALLNRGEAAWVLYKLDRGIDHVLVDEAQDTNPQQWDILRRITEDFTSGHGARGRRVRTLFAVGDPKQSIYGFQGAAPQEFEAGRRVWKQKTEQAELPFEDVRLTLSFRSARAVLSAVDAVFGIAAHFKGLSFEDAGVGTTHVSARPEAPGRVELWPVETPADEPEPDAWVLPLDQPEPTSPAVTVARRVAQAVRCWTTKGDDTGRVWRAGDILVLARKRGAAFDAVIRALKEAGVPVAGTDRLEIGSHIAVLDLVAAGRSALLPQDDLTLATALKSPLVGLTDDDLVRIAARRGPEEALVDALRRHAAGGCEAAVRGVSALEDWRALARSQGPFGFYATLLGPREGRARLVARLGSEAGDAIDTFLCSAHHAESGPEAPSLTAFLARFEPGSGRDPSAHTVKRDLDSTRDEIRVMTVHGAKGLEAPLVVLIDGCEVLGRDPALVPVSLGSGAAMPVWAPGRTSDCARIGAARDELRARGLEEHNRLLYVAMTRAKDRLVIAPFMSGRSKESPQEAWCEMVRRSLVESVRGLILEEAPYGPVHVWREEDPRAHKAAAAEIEALAEIERPAWLTEPVPHEPEPQPPVRPSGALAAADRLARPGDGPFAPDARLRGTLVHALVERLPAVAEARREELARAYVAARAPQLGPDQRERVVRDALGVLRHEGLSALFGPGSRAEAAVAGRIVTPDGTEIPVSGQIDRLAVLPDRVLVADFKTTARPPREGEPIPERYVAQLALYQALMREIVPDRPVHAYLVWTSGPLVRELSEGELDGALRRIKPA